MKKTLLLLIAILMWTFTFAQNPGDLFTGFGTDGVIYEEWTDSISRAYDIGIQSDGHLILSGQLESSSKYDILVSSLDNEGNLCSFGNCSRGFIHEFTDVEFAKSVKVLPDDKILIAGFWEQLAPQAFVIRLLANGMIDEEFAENGILDLGDHWMEVNDVDVVGDATTYKIILGGKNGSDNPVLTMLNQDGTVETGFGSSGFITDAAHPGEVSDIVVDNENNVFYISVAYSGFTTAIAKFNADDGSPVTDFGAGGVVSSASLPIEISFNALVLDAVNEVLAAFGQYRHAVGDLDMCALRLNTNDGSIDTDFGIDGWAWLRSADSDEYLTSALLQSDDKYYFGGYSDFNGNNDFIVGRMTSNGLGDNTFGLGGLMLLPLATDQILSGIVLSPDESILYAAGFSYTTDEASTTVAAFHTTEISTGTRQTISNDLIVYPNPAQKSVWISTGESGNHQLTMSDLSGRTVLRKTWKEALYELNVDGIAPAVYILRIQVSGNRTLTTRIIKK